MYINKIINIKVNTNTNYNNNTNSNIKYNIISINNKNIKEYNINK